MKKNAGFLELVFDPFYAPFQIIEVALQKAPALTAYLLIGALVLVRHVRKDNGKHVHDHEEKQDRPQQDLR